MLHSPHKIKLLIVVPTLICGGVQRTAAILCNHIDTEKYDVTLAVLNNADPFFTITNPGVKLINMQIAKVRNSLLPVLKLSKQIKPQIILLTSNHLNLFFGIFRWLFPRNIKMIARESSIVSINNKRAPNPVFYDWLTRVFYKKMDLIVCQSKYMQQDLVTNYGINEVNTRVIQNAVVPIAFKENTKPHSKIAELITIARLSEEKGLGRLIKAVSYLTIPFRLTIIGEGSLRNELEKQVKELGLAEKVIFAGRQNEPLTKVADADVFLMGSYYEGFPNAMLEAMAAGIPAIAFNVPGGIEELLIADTNGILVEGTSEHDFSVAIEKALRFNFDSQNVRDSVLSRFHINTIMQKWYELFESLAQIQT